VIVHRIARAPFAALDGEGARLFGGRWNSPGRPAVYAAATPSLAVLEVMVHLDLPAALLPADYRLLSIEIPVGVPSERLPSAPTDAAECIFAGDDFLARNEALVLIVPSVIVTSERNAIINVRHPAMSDVRLISNEPFTFDPRLLDPTLR
jgi:RES domain-containing protein